MSNSNGYTPKGAVLSIGTPGAGETFTTIGQVVSGQWTAPKAAYDDITNLSSPTVGAATLKEYLPTTVEPGQFTCQAVLVPSDPGYQALVAAFQTQTVYDFKVQFPKAPGQTTSGALATFSGYVDEMPVPDGFEAGKAIRFKLSVKLSSIITLTFGS